MYSPRIPMISLYRCRDIRCRFGPHIPKEGKKKHAVVMFDLSVPILKWSVSRRVIFGIGGEMIVRSHAFDWRAYDIISFSRKTTGKMYCRVSSYRQLFFGQAYFRMWYNTIKTLGYPKILSFQRFQCRESRAYRLKLFRRNQIRVFLVMIILTSLKKKTSKRNKFSLG